MDQSNKTSIAKKTITGFVSSGKLAIVILCLFLGLLAGCNNSAGIQKDSALHLNGISGELELKADYQKDKDNSSASDREGETLSFQEQLTLSTSGDIYHPNLLAFSGALGFGLIQQHYTFNDDDQNTDSYFNEYELDVKLLSQKKYPLSFRTDRNQQITPRQFLGSLDSQETNNIATWNFNSQTLPMTLQWMHTDLEQEPFGDQFENDEIERAREFDYYSREAESVRYSTNHSFTDNSRIKFDMSWDDITQSRSDNDTNTKRQRYHLGHEYTFGQDKQHRLNSIVEYNDQVGEIDLRSELYEERLTLQHFDSFLTNYNFSYNKDERRDIESTQLRGDMGFEHRLYESLVTNGNVYVADTDLDDQGNIRSNGAMMGINYRKKNPIGSLDTSYMVNFSRFDQDVSTDNVLAAINEPHTFIDPFPIILNNENIDPDSIIVKDSTGLIVYIKGQDYSITEVGNKTHINVNLFDPVLPNISDGDALLIDYNYEISPDKTEDTLQQKFRIRHTFDFGMFMSYEHTRRTEDIDSESDFESEDNFYSDTYGLGYSKDGLNLLSEYTEKHSLRSPYNSTRLEGRYFWQLQRETLLNLYVTQNWLRYGEPDERDTDLFRSGIELYSQISERLSANSEIAWRDELDSKAGTTRGFSVSGKLQYKIRQTRFGTGISFDSLDRSNEEGSELGNENVRFFFEVKRRF